MSDIILYYCLYIVFFFWVPQGIYKFVKGWWCSTINHHKCIHRCCHLVGFGLLCVNYCDLVFVRYFDWYSSYITTNLCDIIWRIFGPITYNANSNRIIKLSCFILKTLWLIVCLAQFKIVLWNDSVIFSDIFFSKP